MSRNRFGSTDRLSVSHRLRHAAAVSASLLAVFTGGPSWGRTIAVTCADDVAGGGAQMHLVYDGEAKGTLHVMASVGDFTLPAILASADDNPDPNKVVAVRSAGAATIKAPDFATMEACEAKRVAPGSMSSGILRILRGDPCFDIVKATSSTAPVQAKIDVVLIPSDPPGGTPDIDLDSFSFQYPDKSASLLAVLRIQLLPPPDCSLDHP